mgnify:CR=1 FL=1
MSRSAYTIKTNAEIIRMCEAGEITAAALAEVRKAIKPGVTTAQLDAIAEAEERRRKAAAALAAPTALERLQMLEAHLDRENLLLARGIRPWVADPRALRPRRN